MPQPHAAHQTYRPTTDGTSHVSLLLSRKRVSFILAGAFLCAIIAALVVGSQNTTSKAPAGLAAEAVTPADPTLDPSTSATGTDPPPGGTAKNTTGTTVNVNGQNIPVPSNSSTSTNSSSSNLNVQVHSHSSSSSSSESVQSTASSTVARVNSL